MKIVVPTIIAVACVGSPVLASVVDAPGGFALRSQANINLGGSTRTTGDVGALGSVTKGWDAFVDGAVEQGSTRTWFTPSLSGWSSVPGSNVYLDWSQTRSLNPGNYGALTSNSSVTLNLSAGEYGFSSFQLGWSGVVNADTSAGDVYVMVNGALSAGDATRFQVTGPGTLYLVSKGNASFGFQSQVRGAVYSDAGLTFGTQASLNGYAYAKGTIDAGYGAQFIYNTVPGPGAMALLSGAAALATGRRRRS